jgi:hypothetical protein
MPWKHPKRGEKYRRRGYTFRVDDVAGGDVWLFQMKPTVKMFRVTLKVWRCDMALAKPINGKRKRGSK